MRKILIIFILLDCVLTHAQQYPFVYYTPKNGLVNSRMRKIYQDSKGRLYFLTYGGFSIYDGARFKNYTSQEGLAVDMVNDIIEAGEDSLLIATNTTAFNVLVRGEIKKFPITNSSYPVVNQFVKSADGSIYMTADEGLFKLSGHTFQPLVTSLAPTHIPPFFGNVLDYQNTIILCTNDLRHNKGLYLYDKHQKKLVDSITSIIVASLSKDKSGRIWISSVDSTCLLDTLELRKGKLKMLPLPGNYRSIVHPATPCFAFDDKNVWTVVDGQEIVRTANDGSQLRLTPYKESKSEIGRIFIDKENIVWVCSGGSGVSKLVNTTLQFINPLDDIKIPGNITKADVGKDTTWYMLNNDKLAREVKGQINLYDTDIPEHIYAVHQCGQYIYVIAQKRLYIGKVPPSVNGKIKFRLLQTLTGYNGYRGITIKDPYGNIIITQKDSISVFKGDRFIGQYFVGSDDLIEGMNFDSHGRLWITGRASRINVFSLHPGDKEFLHREFHFEKELEVFSPRCMTIDKNDIVWIGTRYNGLLGYRLENTSLKKKLHLQIRQGLTDDFITTLACDSSNHILVGSQAGLDRISFDNNEYRIENITKRNNVFGYIHFTWLDNQQNAYALLYNGSILKVEPVQTATNNYKPSLFVQEIKINGTPRYPGNSDLKLPYSQRNISFNMAAPAFVDEQQVQYSYLLQGSGNNEWSEPSSNAEFNFLNLSPGRYTLNVKATFPSTNYPPGLASYTFTIIPPWWQTFWFRILAGIAFVGSVVLIIRFYYSRKLETEKALLEKQQAVEKERTRIATDMHDDLGAGLSRIKFLSETIGIKKQQHEPIEEDIGKIREYSHDMIDKMGEIVWALNQKNDSLSDLLSYTRAYAAEYLSQNGIECTVSAPEQFPSIFVSGEFRRNIYLTVKEALHNIVKHAQATHVCISIQTGKMLIITIHDNGTGFSDNQIRPFGNGLINMKKRMESLDGECRISNNKGTEVMLLAPLQ
jgi:signal transduction histidine kinase